MGRYKVAWHPRTTYVRHGGVPVPLKEDPLIPPRQNVHAGEAGVETHTTVA